MIFDRVTIKTIIPYESEIFYETAVGVVYPRQDIAQGTKLTIGERIPLNGMFEIYELLDPKVCVAYLFKSSFALDVKGGYLVTFLNSKGQADSHEIVLKLDNLVIYNFPNRGTLAASPKVKDEVAKILEAQ